MIPRIGASYVVVKGTDTADLKSGPGIYPETRFPGIAGTTAIAGHRTTYLAPFRHIDSLAPGNHILLDMPYAHFTYTVIGQRVVSPTDVARAVAKSATAGSCCRPARRCSAPPNACSCTRALTRTVPVGAARRAARRRARPPIEAPRARAAARAPLPAMLESLEPHVVSPLV